MKKMNRFRRQARDEAVRQYPLSELVTLECRETREGLRLRVLLQKPLEEYRVMSREEAAYLYRCLREKYSGVEELSVLLQLAS